MAGHLFIVQGDLTRLACDAWLLPTSRGLQIRQHWLRGAPAELLRRISGVPSDEEIAPSRYGTWYCGGRVDTPPGWSDYAVRSFDLKEWPTDDGRNRPWPTNVVVGRTYTNDEKADWAVAGALDFVQRAAEALSTQAPAYGRARHLLALPVVATDRGGGWQLAGAIIRRLVAALSDAVTRLDCDVVVVTYTRDMFAAAQHARRQVIARSPDSDTWAAVPDPLLQMGKRLADHSTRGELVLFLGAGVSRGAGLPDWRALLDELADKARLDPMEREALGELTELDRAALLQDRLEQQPPADDGTGAFADAIRRRLDVDRYDLQHAMLASLSVRQVVTTNYDTLFETASEAAGYTTSILPDESSRGADRWLLKLHGSITQPDDIVLTRQDFLRFADRRAALGGIVQALLITQHMLFVGYSLEDPNFLRIVDDVRKVVRSQVSEPGKESAPFATALLLNPSPLLSSLWKRDIECIPVQGQTQPVDGSPVSPSVPIAARQLEVMLDHTLFHASSHVGHLLDDRYEDVLDRYERELRDRVRALTKGLTPEIRALPAWREVARMLEALGDPGHS